MICKEYDNYQSEAEDNDSRIDVGDTFPTVNPYFVVPAQRLHGAPETVSEVEPQCAQPNKVKHYEYRIAEGVLNVIDTVGCICQREGVSMHAHVVHQLGKLHFSPEVYQVQAQTHDYDDTQYEHVLRSPFHSLGLFRNGIAFATTCLTVLHSQPESVDDVDDE